MTNEDRNGNDETGGTAYAARGIGASPVFVIARLLRVLGPPGAVFEGGGKRLKRPF